MKHYRILLFGMAITILILSFCIWKLEARQTRSENPAPIPAANTVGKIAPTAVNSEPQHTLPDPFADAVKSSTATLRIQALIVNGTWQYRHTVCPKNGDSLSLKIDSTGSDSIRWYHIFPDITKYYNNAYWPNEPKAYQWKGIDKINYIRSEISEFRNRDTVTLFENGRFQYRIPNNIVTQSGYFQKTAGSFWYQVEILKDGKILRSPGIDENTSQGLSPEVFRLTLQNGNEGYLSYLTGFFNVPGIFGSTIKQSSNYIGVDCADVLMAAYAEWKNKPNQKNYNVAMLVGKFPRKAEFKIQNGQPDKTVKWNEHISPGDFIAVRYNGARTFQHIGALYSDKNQNGILDASDWVIHAGPAPLHLSALKEGNFNGRVVILKPK